MNRQQGSIFHCCTTDRPIYRIFMNLSFVFHDKLRKGHSAQRFGVRVQYRAGRRIGKEDITCPVEQECRFRDIIENGRGGFRERVFMVLNITAVLCQIDACHSEVSADCIAQWLWCISNNNELNEFERVNECQTATRSGND